MKNKPAYSSCCMKLLFDRIPELKNVKGELKKQLERFLGFPKSSAVDLVYDAIFLPFILELINKPHLTEEEKDIIKRGFELIEYLVSSEYDEGCPAPV